MCVWRGIGMFEGVFIYIYVCVLVCVFCVCLCVYIYIYIYIYIGVCLYIYSRVLRMCLYIYTYIYTCVCVCVCVCVYLHIYICVCMFCVLIYVYADSSLTIVYTAQRPVSDFTAPYSGLDCLTLCYGVSLLTDHPPSSFRPVWQVHASLGWREIRIEVIQVVLLMAFLQTAKEVIISDRSSKDGIKAWPVPIFCGWCLSLSVTMMFWILAWFGKVKRIWERRGAYILVATRVPD